MQRDQMAPKIVQTQRESSSIESKRPQNFSSYVALMSKIIDSKPFTYEEAAKKQVWKDAMMEEYQSRMMCGKWF
jgi:hypothetical protein